METAVLKVVLCCSHLIACVDDEGEEAKPVRTPFTLIL